MSESKTEGIVFGIQRFSIHDGPGIRTTVFLKGCNMRCSWCHNPESYRPEPVLAYNTALCVGCRACEAACPRGAHEFPGGDHRIVRGVCMACGACARVCPQKALEIIGTRTGVDALMAQIGRDRRYYRTSGGGVTLSGGEALLQRAFCEAILRRCRDEGIHTALETNGSLPFERYEAVMDRVDLFLVDNYREGEDRWTLYEWNILHHYKSRSQAMIWDIDGLLCKEPPDERQTAAYEAYLPKAVPMIIPTTKIGMVCTYRLDKYRKQTEDWLRRQGIDYEQLVMAPNRHQDPAAFKAAAYRSDRWQLFMESNDKQAARIHDLTGKPVYCYDTNRMYI